MGEYELAKDMVTLHAKVDELDYKINMLLEAAGVIKKEKKKQ